MKSARESFKVQFTVVCILLLFYIFIFGKLSENGFIILLPSLLTIAFGANLLDKGIGNGKIP